MYGAMHPKGDVDRLFMKRKEGGRDPISVEQCVKGDENSLGFYVANSEELLTCVFIWNYIDRENNGEGRIQKEKGRRAQTKNGQAMHGQFVREMREKIDRVRCWEWSRSDLKVGKEALLCAAQKQAKNQLRDVTM